MTERSLSERVTSLEAVAETTLLAVQQLALQQRETQRHLTDSIQDLIGMMNEQRREMAEMRSGMAEMRSEIAEMQSEVRGLQRENRQILDILLNRQNPDTQNPDTLLAKRLWLRGSANEKRVAQ